MNLNTIAEELFAKIRGRFPGVTIGDEDGNVTTEPAEARFFEFPFREVKDSPKISISLDPETGVTVMHNKQVATDDIAKQKWYNFLRELRTFSKKRMLNFDVRNITKSNLEKRDYKYLARNSGESSMNESKLYGTSKLSYQDVDGARLVIKHTESVNPEIPTGRTRNIGVIYIESPEGERFKYPYRHLAGARAMARHVAEGGTTYDEFGNHIVELSEELSKLRKFKNYMGRSKVMAEGLADYMDVVHERISTVKKRIEKLQKPSFYKEAFETYEKPVFEEVPEDVKENWIDQLTIKQFNEDLKDVFPYIYKLVGEATRAKELGPEDLMSENPIVGAAARAAGTYAAKRGIDAVADKFSDDDNEVEEGPLDKVSRKFNKAMSWGDTSPEELKQRVRNMSDDELKLLAKKPNEKPGGSGSERGLQMKLINQEIKRRFGIKPGKDSGDKWESTIESAFDKLMGQWNEDEGYCCSGCESGGECEADDELDEISKFDLVNKVEDELQKNKRKLIDLKKLKAEIWGDTDKQTMQAILKKEIELTNNINQLQAKAESAHAEADEEGEQQTPLSEFILSFYDRSTGTFPKGETAVLTMVEKDYGEEFIEPAKIFIERVNLTFEQHAAQGGIQEQPAERGAEEFDRIRHLAGL